jgi:hypothetical protein
VSPPRLSHAFVDASYLIKFVPTFDSYVALKDPPIITSQGHYYID